jgi:cell division topological specificity factor
MPGKSSVSIAKNRLHTLVTSDRMQCTFVTQDMIRRELYDALSKYIELTEENFSIEISRDQVIITFAGEKK